MAAFTCSYVVTCTCTLAIIVLCIVYSTVLVTCDNAIHPDPEMAGLKKAHKQAVKEEKREKRKNKIPKHVKRRKEKVIKQRHGK